MLDKNKVLVLGKGFLGKAFEQKGYRVVGREVIDIEAVGFIRGSGHGSPANFDIKSDYLKHGLFSDVEVIVNCVAKSNTRWCEKTENYSEALVVNGLFPAFLSKYCALRNKMFVHISTGCLYDNKTENNTEGSFLAAHCNYTSTKCIAEELVDPSRDLILRPRLLFGDFEDRNNLLCKLPDFDRYVSDINSVCSVHTIVEATQALLDHGAVGTFNVCNDGDHSLAAVVDYMMRLKPQKPTMTGADLIEQEGLYLVNNTMDCSKLKQFYQPPETYDEVVRCWKGVQNTPPF